MLAAMLVLVLLAPPARAAADVLTRTYDLTPIAMPIAEDCSSRMQLLAIRPQGNACGPEPCEGGDYAFTPLTTYPDTIVDLVTRVVTPEQWEFEGRSIQLIDGEEHAPKLMVRAPSAVHEEVARLLDTLTDAAGASSELEVRAWRIEGAAQRAAAGAIAATAAMEQVEAAARAAGMTEAARFTIAARSGRVERRARLRDVRFIRAYLTEIAEASTAVQSINDSYALGTDVMLRADRTPNGAVLVSYAVSLRTEDAPLSTIDLHSTARYALEQSLLDRAGAGVIQVPTVRSSLLAGTLLARAGETRSMFVSAARADGSPAGVMVAIGVHSVAPVVPPFKSGDRALLILDPCFATSCLDPLPRAGLARLAPANEDGEGEGLNVLMHPYSAAGGVTDLLIGFNPDPELQIDQLQCLLFAFGTAAQVESARDWIGTMFPQPAAPAGIELDGGDGEGVARVFSGRAGGLALSVAQTVCIRTYEVSVATRASVACPVVAFPPSGFSATIFASEPAQRGTSVRFDVESMLRVDDHPVDDVRTELYRVVHTPTFVRGDLSDARVLTSGTPVELGAIELVPGRTVGLRARLR